MFRKLIDQAVPVSEDERRQCLHQLEPAKNRFFNMRIPGSLMSDDDIREGMFRSAASKDLQRSMEIREKAIEAFARYNAEESVKRAARARGRAPTVRVPSVSQATSKKKRCQGKH